MEVKGVGRRAITPKTYAALAPAVVWPGHENLVPKHLLERAAEERTKHSPACVKEEIATLFDALVYLHSASLAVPFNKAWFDIYAWLFARFFPEHAAKLGLPSPAKLEPHEEYELEQLRRWIYRQQVKAIKAKLAVITALFPPGRGGRPR